MGKFPNLESPMSRPCPCQSKLTYEKCCQPYIDGRRPAEAPAQLMRSRFSAYALGKVDYLMITTCAAEREKLDRLELASYCKTVKCVGLKIVSTQLGGKDDAEGLVTFHASLQVNGKRHLHIEKSRFIREEGRWVYVDGETN
jgi:SEC-C motif-containing protein